MTLYNKKYYFILLAAFAIIILPHIYYGDGRLLNAGDFAWPMDFERFFGHTLSTWDDSSNYGYSSPRQHASVLYVAFGSLLTQLDLSAANIQNVIFSVSVAISLYGTVQLGRVFAWSEEQYTVFSLLYLLSSISLHYWAPDHGLNIFAYLFLPVTIALALKFLTTNNFWVLIPFFIISGGNPTFSNPAFFVAYTGTLLFFLIFSKDILSNRINLKSSSKVLVIFIFLTANLHWLLPFIIDFNQQFNSSSNAIAGLISDYDIAVQDSSKLFYSILGNGSGLWTSEGIHGPGMPIRQWGEFIRSNLFIFFNILVVLISMLPIFYGKREKRYIIFIGAYVFLIVLVSGLKYSFPINLIPELFLDIPGFERGFRSLFMKFGLVLAFIIALVMSYSVKTPFKIATYIFILLSSLPFISATNYSDNNGLRPPEYMTLPAEYEILREISVASTDDFPASLIILPFNPKSYNVQLRWGINSGYIGSEFIRTLWHGPTIFFNEGSVEAQKIIENCNAEVFSDCISYLQDHGNSFFLVRNDSQEDRNVSNYIRSKLLNLERLGLLKTVEKNNFFHLFQSVNTVDNSAHFLSINCLNSNDLSSSARVNGSLITINSSCDDPTILKSGNHRGNWWLCHSDKYQKNISNNIFLKKQKINTFDQFIRNIGCGIAYKSLTVFSFDLKENSKYIVYPGYIVFILAMFMSLAVFLIITILAVVQTIKNKAYI
jgi:hypothetical protein